MPFERPTLAALVTRVRADFRARLGIAGALLRRAMADVLAATWAGAVHMLHGHLEWLAKQLFVKTAERAALLNVGSMWGLSLTPATYAIGTVEATGTNGVVIGEDEILKRDDGVTYRVTADATISGGVATVSIEAVNAGESSNLAEGESLEFESPIVGVNSTVEVTGADGISGGFDEEDIEEFRARLLLHIQEPPEGGADQDYIAWATAVAGVTRAWVYRHENGLGTVVVRFVMDDLPDIFPDGAAVAAVQTALNAERPTTAEVTAEAPAPLEVDFDIALTPNTTAVQNAVLAELEDLLKREAEPGDGAGRGTILLSHLLVAIGVADGVEDFVLNSPAADVVPAVGELAVMGTPTWS